MSNEISKSPRIRFSLRTLLVVVAVCAVGMGAYLWIASPKTSHEYMQRGRSYQERGKHRLAIAHFSRALELIPEEEIPEDPHEVLFARAVSYNNTGEYENALADISSVIRIQTQDDPFGLNPPHPLNVRAAYLLRANVYLQLDQKERALEDIDVLLKLDDEDELALHLLGIADEGAAK